LIERLNTGLHRKLTLVSAPAGFGKTTLLSEWTGSCERPVAWLSLDEADNNPAHFLAYFIAALQTLALSQVEGIEKNIGEGTLSVLQSPQPPPIEAILTPLVNEIATIPNEFVLILDDYHLIRAKPIHDAFTFLLDHLPPPMRLVIATRQDPPLPLARLRGRGEMTEIRASDLRFTEEEATAFLNQTMGLGLTPDEVAALEVRTEGWIAGLHLAALSLKGQADRAAFIRAFAGDDRHVMDYLVSEVLSRQSEAVQRFLLHTAILDRLCGPLCDAVVGSGDQPGGSQAILEYLEQANLFIVPLDNRRQWYRYHHLFAGLLRHRLRRTVGAQGIAPLHRRASAWYASNDMRSKAIDHSLAAEDWGRVAQLIDEIANDVLGGNAYFTTILGWLDAMPQEVVRANPHLSILRAWMLLLMPRPDDAERCLQEIESATNGPLPDEVRLQIVAMRAFLARQQKDTHKALDLSHQVLDALDEGVSAPNLVRPLVALNLANVYRMIGDVVKAEHWFSEVLVSTQEAGITLTLAVISGQAASQIMGGKLHQAAETYRQGLQLADTAAQQSGRAAPAAALIHTGLGDLLREWNKLDEAEHHLTQGIERGQRGQVGMALCNGYLFLARLRLAQGDMAGALDMLQQAEQLPEAYQAAPRYSEPVGACRARLMLTQARSSADDLKARRLEAVEQWAEARGLSTDVHISSVDDEFEHLVWARLLIAQGNAAQALQLLAHLLQAAEEFRRVGRVIEILALQALAQQALGDIEQALAILERALSLAEPEGYVRLFADEGLPMTELLRQAASRGIAPDYVGRLLAAIEPAPAPERPLPAPLLLDPLSDRELEVLRWLSTDLSGPEIAEELVVSMNTIKTHIKRIYSKLNAHSRYEAVERAKELDLL